MTTRGRRLRAALAARGIGKQQALAVRLGVHESSLTRWMQDGPLGLDSAMVLATTLDISLDWLLLGRGEMDAPPFPGRTPRMNPEPAGQDRSGDLLTSDEIDRLVQVVEDILRRR